MLHQHKSRVEKLFNAQAADVRRLSPLSASAAPTHVAGSAVPDRVRAVGADVIDPAQGLEMSLCTVKPVRLGSFRKVVPVILARDDRKAFVHAKRIPRTNVVVNKNVKIF